MPPLRDPEPCSVNSFEHEAANLESLPSSWNWTQKGAVTGVKDQVTYSN